MEGHAPNLADDFLDETDRKILKSLLKIGDVKLREISDEIGVSKSTVHNRLKRMRDINFLKGFYPLVNQEMLPEQVTAVSLIRARYGPSYSEIVARDLGQIEGIWAVYYVMGDNDFVVLIRGKSRADISRIVDRISNLESIERSSTILVMNVFKEDPREAVRTD